MADPVPARSRGAVWVVGIGAALMVAIGIDGPSLWTDEGATVSAATRSVGDLMRMAGHVDAVHTAYYLFMHVWIEVFGSSATSLRAPSALAVGAVVAGTWWLADRLVGRAAAWWSAAACLLLPRIAWAGVEARSYALVAAVAVWATAALVGALRSGRARWWWSYGVLVAAAPVLHLDAVLLVPAHGLTVLALGERARLRRWMTTVSVAMLPAVALLLVARGQTGQVGTRSGGLVDLVRTIVVNQWFLGETPSTYSRAGTVPAAVEGALAWWRPASVALALVCLGLVAVQLWRLRRGPVDLRPLMVWAVPWAALPAGVLAAYGAVTHTYSPRYLTFTAPAFALLLGACLAGLTPVALRIGTAVLLVGLCMPVLVSQRQVNAKSGYDWSQVAQVVGQDCGPGDWVYFAPRVAPPTGELAALTTRGVSVAYPHQFEGLRDLTLVTSPEAAGDLVGRSRSLDQSTGALAQVDRLCVVERNDYAQADADAALLDAAGLHLRRSWTGTISTVELRTRD